MKRRLLITSIFLLAGAVVNVAVAWARLPAAQDIQRDLASLANTYAISIEVERGHLDQLRDEFIASYAVSELAFRRYGPIFLSEFAVYPPGFVKATTLRRIVLCSHLAWRGTPVEAITNLDRSTLYFDVGPSSSSYQRRVIHHEFFHVVDYADDRVYADEEWEELNPPSFSYGSGGWSMRMDPTASRPDDSMPGFLNKYSTSGVEEDKAEIFSHMIVDHAAVNDRTKTDAVLRHKVEMMKNLVLRTSPDLTNEFWDTLPARPRHRSFAINTLFYAVILWLLCVGPFALRRLIRVKRGLCSACAYPRGESGVCTECGKAIPSRKVTAT